MQSPQIVMVRAQYEARRAALLAAYSQAGFSTNKAHAFAYAHRLCAIRHEADWRGPDQQDPFEGAYRVDVKAMTKLKVLVTDVETGGPVRQVSRESLDSHMELRELRGDLLLISLQYLRMCSKNPASTIWSDIEVLLGFASGQTDFSKTHPGKTDWYDELAL